MIAQFENLDMVRVLARRKLHISIIVGIAVILAILFSSEWFMTPKYKSTAIVYPVNVISYSMESPTEQLLQLFRSSDVRSLMVKRFQLAKHYKIDTAATGGKTRLYNTYEENVMIRKTEFESVKIDILDTDPKRAAYMVDSLIHFSNLHARKLQREKTAEVVNIFKNQLHQKQIQIDSLEKIMTDLRQNYGLLDYKAQSKELTKSYLKLVSDGASKEKLKLVDSLRHNIETKGGQLVFITEQLSGLQDAYNQIKTDYDKAVSDLDKELTYSNVMARPYPADSKSYPVRWLIVLASAASAFLLALILFFMLDRRHTIPHADEL